MRVALDGQLTVGTPTGIGEYAVGLANALAGAGVEVLFLNSLALNPWRFDRRVAWDQFALPVRAVLARADVLHCASGTMPLLHPAPIVVTVHDVAWLRVQHHVRWYARAYFGGFAKRQYRRARRVLVDSAFSGAELAELAGVDPSRIDVVYPGIAADVLALRRRGAPDPFVLVIGTVEPRKNIEVVIRALARVPPLRLVSVGPSTPYREYCERLADDVGVSARVEFRGYVPRSVLLDELCARAACIAVPSVYEGFGYAAAWALAAGIPLIAARASSLPEIVAGAAPLLPPHDVNAWADALQAIVDDRSGAERRAAAVRDDARRRFSWANAAAAAAESYRRALAQ